MTQRQTNPSPVASDMSSPLEQGARVESTLEYNRLAANRRRCVVKKHRATRLHYDLRLEFDGVLLSWALPEGPSYRVDQRRVAIEMEDHDSRYMTSERVIPHGVRGAGPVMLWDEGFWLSLPGYENIRECQRSGCLRFALECHKLKGRWTLRRSSHASCARPGQIWMLIKEPDPFARGKDAPDILTEAPNSVLTGRTLEAIERDERGSKTKGAPLAQQVFRFPSEL